MNAAPLLFTVLGDPEHKRRARAVPTARGIRVMQPRENQSYEAKIATIALAAGAQVHDGPVILKVIALYAVPRSRWRVRQPIPEGLPRTGRPDWDNIGKIVSDALNGVAWIDDSQVVEASVAKRFAAQGEAGRLIVQVHYFPESWRVGKCIRCGCTDDRACVGGCAWTDETRTICTSCA